MCQLLTNIVGLSDMEKTNKSIQIIFYTTLQLLKNDQQQMAKNVAINESANLDVMNQFITEFFSSIVEKCHYLDADLIKPYRREILELFTFEHFFQVTLLNLRQWQNIMKYFIDGKPDEIFEEQMQKWNFQGGFFLNNNSLIGNKCYAMKRIAFLIFSCPDDDFLNQLDQLMKKMIEVFKQKNRSDIK